VYLASAKNGQLFSGKPKCVVNLPRFTDPVELVFLEANGDGWTDIGYGARDGAIFVFLGNGRGTFGAPAELNAAPDLEALCVADLDGDGIDEFLAAVGAPGLIILPGR
jgi:VCBS repeat protein